MAELKPDVIREHILLHWLAFKDLAQEPPVWELTEEAEQLLELLEQYASGALDLPKVQRVLGRLWVRFVVVVHRKEPLLVHPSGC